MPNNYDRSSTGISISAFISYDVGLSQINWEENFVSFKGYEDFYYYIDWGNEEVPRYEDMFKVIGSIEDKIKFLGWEGNEDDYFESELDYEIIADLSWGTSDEANEELQKLSGEILSLELKDEYEEIVTRGYSQGDYAVVYTRIEDGKPLIGSEEIHNLFWDCPIYGRVEIKIEPENIDKSYGLEEGYEEEFEYNELTNSSGYEEFKREEFINCIVETVKKNTGINITAQLEELIPEELEYV